MSSYRYFIEIGYNGSRYNGWQIQISSLSIQKILTEKLTCLFHKNIKITGSSRTDKGVHCLKQFAHFDTNIQIDTSKLVYQVNSLLPKDIIIYSVYRTDNWHHARFDAIARTYSYNFVMRDDPFSSSYANILNDEPNIVIMNIAASLLYKYSYLKNFSKTRTDEKTYRCRIIEAYWKKEKNRLVFTIKANRFLRGMVRLITSGMILVGTNRITLEDWKKYFLEENWKKYIYSIQPNGLFLNSVEYPINYFSC